jgi:hypothetical protein
VMAKKKKTPSGKPKHRSESVLRPGERFGPPLRRIPQYRRRRKEVR